MDAWYYPVAIKGSGEHPMILLTSQEVNIYDPKSIYRIAEI